MEFFMKKLLLFLVLFCLLSVSVFSEEIFDTSEWNINHFMEWIENCYFPGDRFVEYSTGNYTPPLYVHLETDTKVFEIGLCGSFFNLPHVMLAAIETGKRAAIIWVEDSYEVENYSESYTNDLIKVIKAIGKKDGKYQVDVYRVYIDSDYEPTLWRVFGPNGWVSPYNKIKHISLPYVEFEKSTITPLIE